MVAARIVSALLLGLFLSTGKAMGADCRNSPIAAAGCVFQFSVIPHTKANAIAVCGGPSVKGVLMPSSTNPAHIKDYKFFFGDGTSNEICDQIWTSLSYVKQDGQPGYVHTPNGDILSPGDFTWASGSAPGVAEPCLAARRSGNNAFELIPRNCSTQLKYTCMALASPCTTSTCASDETCVPVYSPSCSKTCVDNPDTTTSTPPTTFTAFQSTPSVGPTTVGSTFAPTTTEQTSTAGPPEPNTPSTTKSTTPPTEDEKPTTAKPKTGGNPDLVTILILVVVGIPLIGLMVFGIYFGCQKCREGNGVDQCVCWTIIKGTKDG